MNNLKENYKEKQDIQGVNNKKHTRMYSSGWVTIII